jgi:hypothetical protein
MDGRGGARPAPEDGVRAAGEEAPLDQQGNGHRGDEHPPDHGRHPEVGRVTGERRVEGVGGHREVRVGSDHDRRPEVGDRLGEDDDHRGEEGRAEQGGRRRHPGAPAGPVDAGGLLVAAPDTGHGGGHGEVGEGDALQGEHGGVADRSEEERAERGRVEAQRGENAPLVEDGLPANGDEVARHQEHRPDADRPQPPSRDHRALEHPGEGGGDGGGEHGGGRADGDRVEHALAGHTREGLRERAGGEPRGALVEQPGADGQDEEAGGGHQQHHHQHDPEERPARPLGDPVGCDREPPPPGTERADRQCRATGQCCQ